MLSAVYGESGAERPPDEESEGIPRSERIDIKDVDGQVRDLREFAQGLLTDKIYLENEIGQLKEVFKIRRRASTPTKSAIYYWKRTGCLR